MLSIKLKFSLDKFRLDVAVNCIHPVTAIFGPSGAGKSTLLNLVAGLLRPDEGEIIIDGEVLFSSEKGIDLPPEKRRVGYVFQDDLLFPHLTVMENLRYGFDLLRPGDRRFKVEHIVELLELCQFLDRFPGHLSGGERQRVALGRVLLVSPKLLVMDEPLASLDQGLKDKIIPYLRHVRSDLGIPMLYVSHSVAEILQLTGQVIVLNAGRMVVYGDFFKVAHGSEVLPLLEAHGFENVLPVEIISGRFDQGGSQVRFGRQILIVPPCNRPAGRRIFIGIRANDIILCRIRPEGISIRNALEGQIIGVSEVGGKQLVYVDVGKRLAVEVTSQAVEELSLNVGEKVVCLIKTHSIRIGPDLD